MNISGKKDRAGRSVVSVYVLCIIWSLGVHRSSVLLRDAKYALEIDADAMLISDFNYFGSVVGGENSVHTSMRIVPLLRVKGGGREAGGAQHVTYRVSRECCALGAGWHFWRPEQIRLVERNPMGSYPSYTGECGSHACDLRNKIGLLMPCCIACAPGLVCLGFAVL